MKINGIFDGCGRQLSLILAALPSITRVGFWIAPSSETLLSLATMPNLHTVINCMYINDVSRPEPACRRLPFPALHVLRRSAPGFKDATAMLTQLQPKFRDLYGLAIHCNEASTTTSPTCSVLSTRHASRRPLPPQLWIPPSNSSLTALLCTFGRIQECRLAALPITLEDALLDALARAVAYCRDLPTLGTVRRARVRSVFPRACGPVDSADEPRWSD